MTHMQTPYESSNVSLYQEPERTSVMAILSMVLGILGCCGGVTSLLAIPLGVLGLIGISRSKGRVGGTGFSIAGIIIGLLTLALWVGLFFGVGGAAKSFMGLLASNAESVLVDIQNDKFDSARTKLSSPAADVPDEEMIAFREAYRAAVGDYVGQPSSLGEWWSGYGAVGQQIQAYQSRQGQAKPGAVPLPLRFDSGWVLVFYIMDTQGNQNAGMPNITELILIDAQGNEYALPMSSSNQPSTPSTPTPPVVGEGEGEQTPEIPDPEGQDQTPGADSTDEGDEGP